MRLEDAALIVVDLQEDFCPPHGALAIQHGRDVAPLINRLLRLPWALRVATLDWHPKDHISFASNHNDPTKTVGSSLDLANPLNPDETKAIKLWPDHCIQDSSGARIIPELDLSLIDRQVRKGQDARIEMFSAFRDSYTSPSVSQSGLSKLLEESKIKRVFVVGLAADYCVKATALHAADDGFDTTVVSDATRAVDQEKEALDSLILELKDSGVKWTCAQDAFKEM